MNKKKILRNLRKLGLTKEEALLYIFLLEIKSATIKEIHDSKEYCLKQRPNLYKLINGLKNKNFVIEEEKGGKKRFFPLPPHLIIATKLDEKEKELKKLTENATQLTNTLENTLKKPFDGFNPLPKIILDFISGVINEDWTIKEPPEIIETKELGIIYSIEFNTHRQFSGSSAGIALNVFRYKEHRDDARNDVKENLKKEMIKNFKRMEGHGPIKFLGHELIETRLSVPEINFNHPYTEFKIKTNMDFEASSACASFIFEGHPKKIINCWGADKRDFLDLVRRITLKYKPLATKSTIS